MQCLPTVNVGSSPRRLTSNTSTWTKHKFDKKLNKTAASKEGWCFKNNIIFYECISVQAKWYMWDRQVFSWPVLSYFMHYLYFFTAYSSNLHTKFKMTGVLLLYVHFSTLRFRFRTGRSKYKVQVFASSLWVAWFKTRQGWKAVFGQLVKPFFLDIFPSVNPSLYSRYQSLKCLWMMILWRVMKLIFKYQHFRSLTPPPPV